ncbi:hypothetical protein OSTOST_12809 [Ostertagia ostertagi]
MPCVGDGDLVLTFSSTCLGRISSTTTSSAPVMSARRPYVALMALFGVKATISRFRRLHIVLFRLSKCATLYSAKPVPVQHQ